MSRLSNLEIVNCLKGTTDVALEPRIPSGMRFFQYSNPEWLALARSLRARIPARLRRANAAITHLPLRPAM
jgi:hypothetical protein